MNKQEVISKLKSGIPKNNIDDYQRGEAAGLNFALLLLAELDEPVRPPEPKPLEIEKPVVPQFVADWYEERKDYFDFNIYGFYKYFYSQGKHEKVKKWLDNAENKSIETLVKMKLYGYEVEKEKLYFASFRDTNQYLGWNEELGEWFMSGSPFTSGVEQTQETWEGVGIWNNPAFEIKKVEE